IALIGSTQTWVTATGFEAAHISHVQLSGQEASPIITAMSLVTIAAGAALSIARNLGRWIIGIVAILSAIAIGWASLSVWASRAEEHTSELQSRFELVCRLLLEKTKREASRTSDWKI